MPLWYRTKYILLVFEWLPNLAVFIRWQSSLPFKSVSVIFARWGPTNKILQAIEIVHNVKHQTFYAAVISWILIKKLKDFWQTCNTTYLNRMENQEIGRERRPCGVTEKKEFKNEKWKRIRLSGSIKMRKIEELFGVSDWMHWRKLWTELSLVQFTDKKLDWGQDPFEKLCCWGTDIFQFWACESSCAPVEEKLAEFTETWNVFMCWLSKAHEPDVPKERG